MISQSPRLRLFRALSLRSQSPARAVGAEESGGVGGALNRAGGQGCPGSHPTPHFWCDQPELAVRATKEPRVASCLPSSLQTWPPAGDTAPDGFLGAGVGGGLVAGGQRWCEDQRPRQAVDREAWVTDSGGSSEGIQGTSCGS